MLNPWDEGYVAPEDPGFNRTTLSAVANHQRWTAEKERRMQEQAGVVRIDLPAKAPGEMDDEEFEDIEQINPDAPPTISLARKIFLDRFVNEYLVDFSAQKAYIRCGGSEKSSNQGYRLLKETYVQRQLRIVQEICDEENIITRADIIWGLKKEANYHGEDGNAGARVKALSVLAKIKGIEAPKKIEKTVRHNVMHVPVAASLGEWEEAASSGQLQLKQDVRK